MYFCSSGWSLYWLIIADKASTALVPTAIQASIASCAPSILLSAAAFFTFPIIFIRDSGLVEIGLDLTEDKSASILDSYGDLGYETKEL